MRCYPGFVQTDGAIPRKKLVKFPDVPDESERKIT